MDSARALIARGWGVSFVSRCLRVSRAQLHVILRRTDDWMDGRRSRHTDDTDVLLRIHHVIGELPTYGYRRVRALLTVLCQPVVSVFKPRKFSVVLRMVSECTATQVAGVVSIRCGLCCTGARQTSVAIKSEKGFCVHSICSLPSDDTQATAVPVRAAWSGVNGGFSSVS